jgi:hypothetical protein
MTYIEDSLVCKSESLAAALSVTKLITFSDMNLVIFYHSDFDVQQSMGSLLNKSLS